MKTIGRYIVRGLLGKGGMGRVYKVEVPVIRKICALKRLEPDPLLTRMMGKKNLAALFQTEAQTMARIHHPNIVDILDYDDSPDGPFYVMDYHWNNLGIMIHESYQTEKPSRIISIEKTIKYTHEILNGLARLHHSGIIHRDIKPFNLLITDGDNIKICDFGLSKLRGEPFRGPSNLNVGSPFYAAPEQENNPDTVDESADIYAVGVTCYRMLTGILPEAGRDNRLPHPPSRSNEDLNTKWDDFLFTALAREPEKRFSTATDMQRALLELEKDWFKRKARICTLASESIQETGAMDQAIVKHTSGLRHIPIKIGRKAARKHFATDTLWRPRHYTRNVFETVSDKTVADRTTGLLWQRSGSPYPMTFPEARNYIQALNQAKYAEKTNWRMPTIDELMSLLTPLPKGTEICMEPVFDPRQKWIWSVDRHSFTSAWYASMDLGFIHWQDFTAQHYAKGVCQI